MYTHRLYIAFFFVPHLSDIVAQGLERAQHRIPTAHGLFIHRKKSLVEKQRWL